MDMLIMLSIGNGQVFIVMLKMAFMMQIGEAKLILFSIRSMVNEPIGTVAMHLTKS
jgi:hypothetical protein